MDVSRKTVAHDPENVAQALEVSESIRTTMLVTAALAVLIAILLDGAVPRAQLAAWMLTSVAVSTLRFGLAHWQIRKAAEMPVVVLRVALAGSFVGGLIWGLLPWMVSVLEKGDPRAPLTMMILSGIAGGSLAMSFAYRAIPIVFCITVLSPVILVGTQVGIPGLTAFVFCVLLFIALIARAATRSEQSFRRHVRLASEQSALTQSLEAATAEAKDYNRALERLARHDTLTGQLNRGGFMHALEARLAKARVTGGTLTLMLLDLDGFKAINDNFGHPAGDSALVRANERINSVLGDLDVSVGRMGGDEFAVALSEVPDLRVEALAEAIIAAMAKPLEMGSSRARIGCSIGIAAFPADGGDAESLISHADFALYAAKGDGRGRSRRFDVGLLSEVNLQRVIETDLAKALAERSLEIHYQPQICLDDGRVTGLEALLRWNHPLLGWIAPRAIIAAARRSEMKGRLMRFALEEVFATNRDLALKARGLRIGINLPPDELSGGGLAATVADLVRFHGAADLEFQIDAAFDLDPAACRPECERLRALGARIGIDNFGAGRSSFLLVESMPIDAISVARRLGRDRDLRPTVEPVIEAALLMGRSMQADVVVKGVASTATADWLRARGCRTAQGRHFAPPMPAARLAGWLAEHGTPARLKDVA